MREDSIRGDIEASELLQLQGMTLDEPHIIDQASVFESLRMKEGIEVSVKS
jgi:hypothetical protein